MLEQSDILILFLLIVIVTVAAFPKVKDRLKRKRTAKRAFRGEKKAVPLLKRYGYRVVDGQCQGQVRYYVDGQAQESRVRCDAIAEKWGRLYVVEIKTGDQAKVTLPQVRRQLLEYDRVFKPHGLLFVDMEREKVQEVHFGPQGIASWRRLRDGLIGLGLGFILALFYQTAL